MFVAKKVFDKKAKQYVSKVVWHEMPVSTENPKVVADEAIPVAAPSKPKKGKSK